MSALVLDLTQFKSSGVYTVEVDQSERIVVTTQSLRLLPGFSTTGPYNTPVFIRSTKDRQKFYGSVDKKLERRGSFFHRSIDTCLLQSPVFALNLLNVNTTPGQDNLDTVNYAAFSLDVSANPTLLSDSSIGSLKQAKVQSSMFANFFNKDRFWKPDTEYLQGVVQTAYSASNALSTPLFQVVNVGTKTLSFIIRKAVGLQGYSVFAKDWYGSASNIPYAWIRPYDLMKHYFIQIIAVQGDWSDYTKLSTDTTFSTYFKSTGLKSDKINDFLNLPQVTLVGSWVGSIIPDLKDNTGADQYIENIVNASTSLTGVLVNVNQQALDNLIWDETQEQWEMGDGSSTEAASFLVDLVGHSLALYTNITPGTNIKKSFLSYDIAVTDASIDNNNNLHNEVIVTLLDSTYKKFKLFDVTDSPFISVGTLVTKQSGDDVAPGVTTVTSKIYDYDSSTYVIETAEPVNIIGSYPTGTIIVQKDIDNILISDHYKIIKMNGLNITSNHMPGYTTTGQPSNEDGLTKIYQMLEDPGISRGLTNDEMIQYRYVVDTMAYGLNPNCGGKAYLSRLAKKRGKCTAIISAPAISHFASSQSPYFCDTYIPGVNPVPVFNSEFIATGGNPDMPRPFRFTLPDEDNGAKYCGVFGPFLTYTEGGITFNVPPAADVSNTFVRKFLGGNPYAIVANQNGILSNPSLTGVEYQIDKTDRDSLEPFGYNSIIQRLNTGQVMIYSNATSYQSINSDYNYLHVRELLNTIELEVEEVLKPYVFSFNNAITRLNIVNSVTPILDKIRDAGALYRYEVVMDDTNNTADIVDEGYAILDIGVWITKGMQKIINRITVNKLGSVSSGGFAA